MSGNGRVSRSIGSFPVPTMPVNALTTPEKRFAEMFSR